MLAVWLGGAGCARAKITVQVVATDPAGSAVTLERNQDYYLRLRYQSDQPIRIWVSPYFRDREVAAGSNPSRIYPAGSGEALGWFFLYTPGERVDAVRILAGDGSSAGTHVVSTYRVAIGQGDDPVEPRSRPGWVKRLNALDIAAQRADEARQTKPTESAGDAVLVSGLVLGALAVGVLGLVTPLLGIWRWRGGWRLAAAVPAMLMSFVILRLLIDLSLDATSHNLWPFEILAAGALNSLVMLCMAIARRIRGVEGA